MEALNIPNHLYEDLTNEGSLKYKYSKGTLIAFNKQKIIVLSDSSQLITHSEIPLQPLSSSLTFTPSKDVSDAFIYPSGIYTISDSHSLWNSGGSIHIFSLNMICKEEIIKYDNKLLAHTYFRAKSGEEYLIFLTQNNELVYYNLNDRMTEYSYKLDYCLEGIKITEAAILPIFDEDILVVHINKEHLVLIDFKHVDIPLTIQLKVHKIISVQNLVNTPSILIICKESEDRDNQTVFYTFKMFNENEKFSIISKENLDENPSFLEPVLQEGIILDTQFIDCLSSCLLLIKGGEENDEIILSQLKILVEDDIIEGKLSQIGKITLQRNQQNITNAEIQSDSIFLNDSDTKFSVSIEYFVENNLKIYAHEFSNSKEKSILRAFFNTINISANFSTNELLDSSEIFDNNEINDILFSGNIDEICAEIVNVKENELQDNESAIEITGLVEHSGK